MNSTRVAALIREAITPRGPPVTRADPARAALIKALATPPLPSRTAPEPVSSQPRQFPLAAPESAAGQPVAAETQAQVLQAYRTIAEVAAEVPDGRDTIERSTGGPGATNGDGPPSGPFLPAKPDDPAATRQLMPALPMRPSQPPLQGAMALSRAAPAGPTSTKPVSSRTGRRSEALPIEGFGLSLLLVGLLAAVAGLVVLTML